MKQRTKFLSLAIALIMTLSLIPFSALGVFAGEAFLVESIEFECVAPKAGEAVSTATVKSVNGDTVHKDMVYIPTNKTYWIAHDSFDTDLPSGWTKATEFEAHNIYLLHFGVLPSETSGIDFSNGCSMTIYDENGNVMWQGNVDADDNSYSFDAIMGYLTEANGLFDGTVDSVELSSDKDVAAGEEVFTPTVKSVNGSEALASIVSVVSDEVEWESLEYGYDYLYTYDAPYFSVGITYYLNVQVKANIGGFSENPAITLATPSISNVSIKGGYKDSNTEYSATFNFDTMLECDPITVSSFEFAFTTPLSLESGANKPNIILKSINNDPSLAKKLDLISPSVTWYASDTNTLYGYYYEEDTLRGGYYYGISASFFRYACYYLSEKLSFADEIKYTISDGTTVIEGVGMTDKDSDRLYMQADFLIGKTSGEPLKKIESTEIKLEGYEIGKQGNGITVSVPNEGLELLGGYGTGYKLHYNDTNSNDVASNAIEANCAYRLKLKLKVTEGYSAICETPDNIITFNGLAASKFNVYYDSSLGAEFISAEFDLPPFITNGNEINEINITVNGYEVGSKIYDVSLTADTDGILLSGLVFKKDFLITKINENRMPIEIANEDSVFEPHAKYTIAITPDIVNGYSINSLKAENVKLNGNTPEYISFSSYMQDGRISSGIELQFELPELHDYNSGWKSDGENHWIECSCGAKDPESIEAHECTSDEGKCDMCGYVMTTPPDYNSTETDDNKGESENKDNESDEKDDETEPKADNGCGGCGSSASLSAIALVSVIGTAIVIKKRKD